MTLRWGVMAQETLVSERRTRTLGLGRSVRHFNELAVPGLGGLWYGKQLLWSILGIKAAEEARHHGMRVSNIEVANALEAIVCLKALGENREDGAAKKRILGRQKLQPYLEKNSFVPFQLARKQSFYVTQPMRMSVVQPLQDLGFVEAGVSRFNSFSLTELGRRFLETACPNNILNRVINWIVDPKVIFWSYLRGSDSLSPYTLLPAEAAKILKESLRQNRDRKNLLLWMDSQESKVSFVVTDKPVHLNSEHWQALKAGAYLFAARDAALEVLDAMEARLSMVASRQLSISEFECNLVPLREKAYAFLQKEYKKDAEAVSFCQSVMKYDGVALLRFLIERDGSGLRLQNGSTVVAGPAFQGNMLKEKPDNFEDEQEGVGKSFWIAEQNGELIPLSRRVNNLFLLFNDLKRAEEGA